MDSLETTFQSFVIKIWLEETAEEAGKAVWRGHITHISSKRRVYLDELSEVIRFIIPYLEQMGIEADGDWP